MARCVALVFLVLAAVCAAVPEFDQLQSSVEVVEDMNTYLAENPDAQLIDLQAQNIPFAQTRYTFGKRVPGDRLLAQRNDNFKYSRAQDVHVNLNYPKNGVGSILSYLDVNLEYDSNMAKLILMEGGIGQRKIKIIIEANTVTRFAANVTLWGY